MLKRNRITISTSKDLRNIKRYKYKDAVTEINLHRLDENDFEKLVTIVGSSRLKLLNLRDCFKRPDKLKIILEAAVDNTAIKSLVLKLKDNECDVGCIAELKKLLSRKVIQSLVIPQYLNQFLLAEVLQEIISEHVELLNLDISCSVLDENCLDLLKYILQHGLIKQKLCMLSCKGVEETTLTDRDKQGLKEAMRKHRRFARKLPWESQLQVVWFRYVTAVGPSAENDRKLEVRKIKEPIRPILRGKLGQVEKLVRYQLYEVITRREYGVTPQRNKFIMKNVADRHTPYSSKSSHESDSEDGADGVTSQNSESSGIANASKLMSKISDNRRPASGETFTGQPQSSMNNAHGFDSRTPSDFRQNSRTNLEIQERLAITHQHVVESIYVRTTVGDRPRRVSPITQMDRRGKILPARAQGYDLRHGNRQTQNDGKNYFDGSAHAISGRLDIDPSINDEQPTTSRTNHVEKEGGKGKSRKR